MLYTKFIGNVKLAHYDKHVIHMPSLNLIQCSTMITINVHKYNTLWVEESTARSVPWFINTF